jgi:hypothetical protein
LFTDLTLLKRIDPDSTSTASHNHLRLNLNPCGASRLLIFAFVCSTRFTSATEINGVNANAPMTAIVKYSSNPR